LARNLIAMMNVPRFSPIFNILYIFHDALLHWWK